MAVSLVSLVILVTLLYLLTGATLFKEKATLYLFIADASGLAQGSPVQVDGITVGKVTAIALSGSRDPARTVRVTIEVDRATLGSLPPDSWAQLSVESPVGDKYVDITSQGTGLRQPSTEITYREHPDVLKSLDLQQFEQQLRNVDALLADIESGRSLVGQFVLGTKMYSDLSKRFTQIEEDLHKAASTTNAVGEALYTDALYRRLTGEFEALDAGLARLESGQGEAGRFLRDNAQYEEARAAAANLRQTVSALGASPFFQSDQLYTDVNQGLAAMIRGVAEFNRSPMLANSMAYDNLNGWAREFSAGLRDFREHPAKYMRVKVF